MSSPWLPETGDDIRDHICLQHIMCISCPWSLLWSSLTQVIQTLFSWCGPHWQRLSYVISKYTCLLSVHYPSGPCVICTLSLWSPETGDDIGNHISSEHNMHVISVVSDVVHIDTDLPQAVPIVLDVILSKWK